jgi:hypothetical protein
MMKNISLLLISILTCLATSVFADSSKDAEAVHLKSDFSGKTIRFDERKLDQRTNALAQRINRYVVYFAPNGTAYTWFPGQQSVVAMRWETRQATLKLRKRVVSNGQVSAEIHSLPNNVCFENFPTKRNLCRNGKHLEISIQEVADGDIFDLGSLTVPCRLCRADIDFKTVLKTTGDS